MLSTPKLKGGIGLLDIHKYYWFCHLARVVDWHVHIHTKDWVRLGESFSQIPIRHLPSIGPSLIPKESTNHPLIGPTLQNFSAACRKLNLASSPGPLTPIDRNPEFPQNLPDHTPHGLNPAISMLIAPHLVGMPADKSFLERSTPPHCQRKDLLS